MEHYERDLPSNSSKKPTERNSTNMSSQRLRNGHSNFFNTNNSNNTSDNFNELNDEYDFYYEKNVRTY